jgi:enolase
LLQFHLKRSRYHSKKVTIEIDYVLDSTNIEKNEYDMEKYREIRRYLFAQFVYSLIEQCNIVIQDALIDL